MIGRIHIAILPFLRTLLRHRTGVFTMLTLILMTGPGALGQHIDSLQTEVSGLGRKEKLMIWAYGKARMQFAVFDTSVQISDVAPRVGAALKHSFQNGWFWFTGVELGVRMVGSAQSLTADPNSSGGYVLRNRPNDQSVLSLRQGYLGVQFGKYGRIALGKIWSPYSEVGQWTDKFEVMGGTSVFVYSPTGTDGGLIGTGRTDNVLIYQNQFLSGGRLKLSAQCQIHTVLNSGLLDSFGTSLRYLIGNGWEVGGAFQLAFVDIDNVNLSGVLGMNGRPAYVVTGGRYVKGPWQVALTAALQWNGDYLDVPNESDTTSVFFNGWGTELFAAYRIQQKWRVLLGFNHRMPMGNPPLIASNAREQSYIFGAQYSPFNNATVYFEAGIDNSISPNRGRGVNVFQLGLKYVFDIRHRIAYYD